MSITWNEIESHIRFPWTVYNEAYIELKFGTDRLINPGRNFSPIEQNTIRESLHDLFITSPTARAALSDYFTPYLVTDFSSFTRDLDIYPNTAGKGVWTIGSDIFLDFNLLNGSFGDYFTLSGTIEPYHLGTALYHEFLHVSDNSILVAPPPVEAMDRSALKAAYSNPNFDHLGSVVSRTNDVIGEVNAFIGDVDERPRGSYWNLEYLNIPEYRDRIMELQPEIFGSYDQAILFRTGESLATFTSYGKIIYGHDSRDLIISLQANNNITTGAGNDAIVGGAGTDTVYAGDDDDKVYGSAGEDHLYGEKGIDRLWGDADNDRLYGGEDNDFLFGGTDDDIYYILRSGSGIDTITDEDGRGLIFLGEDDFSPAIVGTAIPVSGGIDGKQFYEIESNHIKLEYDSASRILNIYDWDGKGTNDKIIINDFDSGEFRIHLVATTTTLPEPVPPPPKPVPPPPEPDTDGSSETLLSVQAVNQNIDVGTKIPLLDLFPMSGWVDNDGVNDIVSFAVADRTSGGGFLEVRGSQAIAGIVYEYPIYDIVNLYFVAGPGAAVDDIGFNIIQTNGDYSPRLEPGAIVTTVVPTESAPKPPGAHTGGGSNLATLSFNSKSTGASSGGSVEVTYTVRNIGDKISAKGKADIVLANTPDLLSGRKVGDDFSIPELNPGEERTYTRIVDVPISGNGNYFLGVDVRSVSLGHNLIESDDTASIPFQIGPGLSGDPDLHPGFSDPKKIFSQDTVETIDFTISTNANGSPPYDYRVLLSRDDAASSDDIVLIDKTSGGLGYVGTHYYNTGITIPNYIPDGLYHLIVAADPFAKIFETNETNNTRARQIVVVSRPADANELSNIVGSHVVVETDIMEVLQSYRLCHR